VVRRYIWGGQCSGRCGQCRQQLHTSSTTRHLSSSCAQSGVQTKRGRFVGSTKDRVVVCYAGAFSPPSHASKSKKMKCGARGRILMDHFQRNSKVCAGREERCMCHGMLTRILRSTISPLPQPKQGVKVRLTNTRVTGQVWEVLLLAYSRCVA
jgi:hypothetical protein